MPTYILRNKDIAQRMVDYIKAVAGPAAKSGRPIVVEIGEYQAKRSTQANARYWALLEEISGQAYVDGKRFSREAWHTYFREQYAPKEDGPAGLTPMSTSQMDKETFQRYVTQIEVYAAETLGVEFAAI
ncbi:recombination protein NinB (plasmid) [Burkholderia cenocepacia]|uniref:recombination protein NinB n=1 Tax=Burkholderia cenocepacia TaxID=95486 RepID=UPI001F24CF5A|nr:recombination protein NinB [Burkholderia cenocepacia]UJH75018.1 recombination protein NinB [Burkholderia cenocepacia]